MVELMVGGPGNALVGVDAGLVDGPDLGVLASLIGGACVDGVDLAGVDRLQTGCQTVRSAVAVLEARLVRRHGELMQAAGMRPDAAAYLTATLGVPSRQTRTAVKVAETLAAVPSVEAALSTGDDAMVHIDALLPPEAGAVVKGVIEHIAGEMWKDDPTDLNNLALLCSRHHHDVHEGGQPLEQADGETGGWQVRRGLPHPAPPRRLEGREEEAVGERRSQDHQTGKPTSWVVSCS